MAETRICRKCGQEKPITEFYFRRDNKKYRTDCIKCCNRYGKMYRTAHVEQMQEYNKKYREEHRDELDEYFKNYRKTHLDKYREYNKRSRENWTDEQKQRANERSYEYRKRHSDKPEFRERLREWNRKSSKKRRKKITAYEEARKKNDPVFKLKKQLRNEIRESFNRRGVRKSGHTEDIVGCDLDYLYRHLCMTYFIRYGEEYDGNTIVHIDHIKPLSNAHTEEEVVELCRWHNLQLLKAEDNLYKNDDEFYLLSIEDIIDNNQKEL